VAFVVDASVALGWSLKDEQTEYARSVLERLDEEPAIAPAVWVLEVANGLLIAERRGRITPADIVTVQEILINLQVGVIDATVETTFLSALPIAREQQISAYDASYLDLAIREGLPLATQDGPLRAAAERVGVPVVP
jgi:predicted nucleic acid-binding protein